MIFVFVVRFTMIVDTPLSELVGKTEFHGNKTYADVIYNKAGELPVVFLSSYGQASKYWFYTGHTAFSLNTPDYYRSSYNFWDVENSSRDTIIYYKSDLKVNQITKQQMQTTLSCPMNPRETQEKLRIVLSTCLPGLLSLNSNFFTPLVTN